MQASTGIIIRDKKGILRGGHTKKFPAFSPVIVEALAVREALALASNCDIGRAIVETDCRELVQAKKKIREIMSIVQDILSFKHANPSLGVTWTPREGNLAAYHVALLSSRNVLPLNWIFDPPSSLQRIFEQDKSQILSNQATHSINTEVFRENDSNRNGVSHLVVERSFPFDPGTSSHNGTYSF